MGRKRFRRRGSSFKRRSRRSKGKSRKINSYRVSRGGVRL